MKVLLFYSVELERSRSWRVNKTKKTVLALQAVRSFKHKRIIFYLYGHPTTTARLEFPKVGLRYKTPTEVNMYVMLMLEIYVWCYSSARGNFVFTESKMHCWNAVLRFGILCLTYRISKALRWPLKANVAYINFIGTIIIEHKNREFLRKK